MRRIMRRLIRSSRDSENEEPGNEEPDNEDLYNINNQNEEVEEEEEVDMIDDFVDLSYLTDVGIDDEIDDEIRRWAPDTNNDIYVDLDQLQIEDRIRNRFQDNIVIFNVITRRVRTLDGGMVKRRRNRLTQADIVIGSIVGQRYREYLDARQRVSIVRKLSILADEDLKSFEDSDDGCVVCLERKSIIEFNCGHRRTCVRCSSDVIRSNHLCPMCREDIRSADL